MLCHLESKKTNENKTHNAYFYQPISTCSSHFHTMGAASSDSVESTECGVTKQGQNSSAFDDSAVKVLHSKDDSRTLDDMLSTVDDMPPPPRKKQRVDHRTVKPQTRKPSVMDLFNHKAKYVVNKDGSLTFWPTPDCKPSTKRLDTTKMMSTSILKRVARGKLEASSDSNLDVVDSGAGISSFISSSIDAWAHHYPIRFKPEHIWLVILQAVAVHVEKNAEKLRKKYVNHKGQMTLEVWRPGFVLGSDENDWEGVIEEFVDQIDANTIKDTVQLFESDFSGSSMMEKICTKVTIMDIMKPFFGYTMMTDCGFPQITLDGTKSDWFRLKHKTISLLKTKVDKEFATKWSEALVPVLDRFIRAFDGDIDCLFWNSMIKRGALEASGGFDFFSGWFNVLFPYTSHKSDNKYCVPYSMDSAYVRQGLKLKRSIHRIHYDGETGGDIYEYPSGVSQVPVKWTYRPLGKVLDLTLSAGFIGYQQDPKTLEICPNLGWCITHKERAKQSRSKRYHYEW